MNAGLKDTEFRKKSLEIRLLILDAIYKAKKGHIGGSYSIVDILVALFYGGILKFDQNENALNASGYANGMQSLNRDFEKPVTACKIKRETGLEPATFSLGS